MKPKVIIGKKWPSREALKKTIRKYLDKKGTADELDIAVAMRITLQFACEVIDELVVEKKIAPVKKRKKS